MAKDQFEKAAEIKAAAYIITPDYTAASPRMLTQRSLMRDIENWALTEVGCSPQVAGKVDGTLVMACTESFMKKLETQFAGKITKVERLGPFTKVPRVEPAAPKPR